MKGKRKAQPADRGGLLTGSGGAADVNSAFDHPYCSTDPDPCQEEISHPLENRPTAATWWNEFVEQQVWGKLTPDGVNLLRYGVSPRWPADGEFDEHTLVLGIDVNLGDGAIKRIGDFLDATQESWPHDLWPVHHIEWEPWEKEKPPPIEVHESDQGNAMRLVHRHGKDLLYCHPWRKWLIWDGRRWRVDDTAEVFRRAKETIRSIYDEAAKAADENERKALAKHALKSEGEPRIRHMIKLAESEPGIPVTPNELDADRWLLNCWNGTLDLRTGELREHRREDRITKLVPVDYDPEATAPTWDAFLQRIMDGNEDLIAFLQRAVGYSLTGDVSERVLFFLYGGSDNGKSTFLETVRALLGDYAQTTPTETLLAKRGGNIPNDVARLRGARFVSASESEEGKRLNEPLIKELTGGDTICARFLHAEFFEFKPQCKIWLATNHKPVVRGTDKAIWNRIKLIPFAVTIPEAEQDKRFGEKLKPELAGILAWAVRGCLEWQENGLGVPSEVKRATESYREEMDILGNFIKDCCVVGHTAEVTAKDVYNAYVEWCKANGEPPISKKAFGQCLKERGFVPGRTGKARVWRGIGLLDVDTVTHRDTMTHGDASSNISESVQPHIEKGENLRHDTSCVIIECEGEKVPF